MRGNQWLLVSAVCVSTVSVALLIVSQVSQPERAVRVRVIKPHLTKEGFLVADPSTYVTVTWEVKNETASSLTDLVATPNCQCQIEHPLSTRLGPGESSLLSVRVSAPSVGTAVRQVPIFSKGNSQPSAVVAVAIKAAINPPLWLSPPSDVLLTPVQGEPYRRELIWNAVEIARCRPWVSGIAYDSTSNNCLDVRMRIGETPWGEEGIHCLRRYAIGIEITQPKDIADRGLLMVSTCDGLPTVSPLVVCTQPLSRFELIPKSLIFQNGQLQSKQIVVIRRTTDRAALVAEFDAQVLSVALSSESKSGTLFFDVIPQTGLPSATTHVRFLSEDHEVARLLVRTGSKEEVVKE